MRSTGTARRSMAMFVAAGDDGTSAAAPRAVRFVQAGSGLREEHLAEPDAATASGSFSHQFDASRAPRSDGDERSWRIDPYLLVGRAIDAGGAGRWTIYAVAADRSTMSLVAWDEATPTRQTRQMYQAHRGD